MSQAFQLPRAVPLDTNGIVIPGARLYFFDAGTTTPRTVYADGGLTVPLPQPVVADADGRFPVIYLPTGPYKISLHNASGVLVYTADELDSGLPAGQGALPISLGGTGADDAAGARANLGAASADDLSDLEASLGALAEKDKVTRSDLASGFGDVCLQRVLVASTTSLVACSDTIPNDDTVPQITEGTSVLAGNFTPKSSVSWLYIETQIFGASSTAQAICAALFTDSNVNAIASSRADTQGQHRTANLGFVHRMAPPGTNQIAFSLRVGPHTGTFYVNGDGSGQRRYGGTMRAQMIISEYLTV